MRRNERKRYQEFARLNNLTTAERRHVQAYLRGKRTCAKFDALSTVERTVVEQMVQSLFRVFYSNCNPGCSKSAS